MRRIVGSKRTCNEFPRELSQQAGGIHPDDPFEGLAAKTNCDMYAMFVNNRSGTMPMQTLEMQVGFLQNRGQI